MAPLKPPQARMLVLVIGIAFVAAVVGVPGLRPDASATHQPADKIAVAGTDEQVLSTPLAEGESSPVHSLFAPLPMMRTSSPTDLIIQVTLECSILTQLVVTGNDNAEEVSATIKVWPVIDGTRVVPVSSEEPEGEEFGKVVFCNRTYGMKMTHFDDDGEGENGDNQTIDSFIETRSAHSFNWIAPNLGNGIHTFDIQAQVFSEVEETSTGLSEANAVIGKRTLVVEPIKLASDVGTV